MEYTSIYKHNGKLGFAKHGRDESVNVPVGFDFLTIVPYAVFVDALKNTDFDIEYKCKECGKPLMTICGICDV